VRIGAVTIGQAPRDDVVPELSRRLGRNVEIVQRGALDGVSLDLIRANPPASGETTLVSRLTAGTEVAVDKGFIVPRLQDQIGTEVAVDKGFIVPRLQDQIRLLEEQGIQLILLLCTHKFEGLDSRASLLRPAAALERIVERSEVHRLGVFTPSEDQVAAQRIRWRGYASKGIRVASASPYLGGTRIEEAAAALRDEGVDIAVMDCIGYTENMRSRAREILNVPVYSATSALGDAAAEVLESETRSDA
jgi:protein AroM